MRRARRGLVAAECAATAAPDKKISSSTSPVQSSPGGLMRARELNRLRGHPTQSAVGAEDPQFSEVVQVLCATITS
jgi:hypothetical protein